MTTFARYSSVTFRFCEEELRPEEDQEMGPEEHPPFSKSFNAFFDAVHILLEQSHGEDKVRERLLGIKWSLTALEPYRNSWIQFFKTRPDYTVNVVAFQSQQDWQSKLLVIEDEGFGFIQEDDSGANSGHGAVIGHCGAGNRLQSICSCDALNSLIVALLG